jgi:hypothetical protein
MMVRGAAPRRCVGEWKKKMARGTAPCHHDVEQKEMTARGTALDVAMFNSKNDGKGSSPLPSCD